MAPILWPLAPHTLGKHKVLKAYLNAWVPILGITNERILFVDGFAGPGRYTGGEPGSPVIAMETLRDHHARSKLRGEVVFSFIEKDPDRARHLQSEIVPLLAQLGSRAKARVITGAFDETVTGVLDTIDEQKKRLAPAFFMVDPFGVSDTPLSVIKRILDNPKSEVYISFMWEWFDRFKETNEFPPHLDDLFGTTDWREAVSGHDWRRRKKAVFALYERQLRAVGGRGTHVVHFELYDGPRLVYAIFFATKQRLGCDKMKYAIWQVDPFDGHAFVPGDDAAERLFSRTDLSRFKNELQNRTPANEWVTYGELEDWAQSDKTLFHSGQLKKALREMEAAGLLEGDPATRNKSQTYPQRTTRVRFRTA